MPLKVPGRGSTNGSATAPATSEGQYLGKLSNLMEFLCSVSGPEGGKREPGTLQVTSRSGKWQLKVKCPNGRVYAFVTQDSLDEALETVELGLESGDLDWRPDTWEGARKGK